MLDRVMADWRDAARQLLRAPLSTAVAVVREGLYYVLGGAARHCAVDRRSGIHTCTPRRTARVQPMSALRTE
ncbi:hypothetical protein BH23GEM10_BH23GEM10_04600 [soil metagenome]